VKLLAIVHLQGSPQTFPYRQVREVAVTAKHHSSFNYTTTIMHVRMGLTFSRCDTETWQYHNHNSNIKSFR